MIQIGWPQAILLFFMAIPMVVAIVKSGEEKPENLRKFNGPAELLRFSAGVGILHWGGFFG
jgi:hypothetical protein